MSEEHKQPTRQRGDDHWRRRMPERVARGERAPAAKLTNVQVQGIRARYAVDATQRPKQSFLARQYGVSRATINGIVRGRRWRDV
jgi:hypothetical protein